MWEIQKKYKTDALYRENLCLEERLQPRTLLSKESSWRVETAASRVVLGFISFSPAGSARGVSYTYKFPYPSQGSSG